MGVLRTTALAVLALAASAGCYRRDVRTVSIRTPDMDSDEAARRVIEAFAPYRELGMVLDVEPNVPERTVTVVYDSREAALKNLEYWIARAGFTANDQPPLPTRAEPSAQDAP